MSDFVLWNPFTAKTLYFEHLTSPPNEFNRKHQPDIREELVYDHINDDYKLVRWHSTGFNGSRSYEVCIYSLKDRSWRTIKGGVVTHEAHEMHLPDLCAFANGAIHWIMKSSELVFGKFWILAFDIVTHKFRKIPFPCVNIPDQDWIGLSYSNHGDRMTFSGLNGCLCLCLRSVFGMDIWVMSEYGVESSWTELTHIDERSYSCNVVAYSEKIGKLVLQPSHGNPVIYDMNTKSSTDVTIDDDDNADDYDNDYGDERSCTSCICVGSFASPG